MLSKAEVLFFAADPLSVGRTDRVRLSIDEEVREIQQKIRAARYRDRLYLNTQWAARPDDLLQALNERHPAIVHFSGHGGERGLVLAAGAGPQVHHVDADPLAELLKGFRGDVRVVVLNACYSLPQAKAVAEMVGCAIGTPNAITDDAAITFSASFYRAIAFGLSVQAAFDQARTALRLHHHAERECPRLEHRADVDPSRLVLIPPRRAKLAATAAVAAMLFAGVIAAAELGVRDRSTVDPPVDVRQRGIAGMPPVQASLPGAAAGAARDLADAVVLRDAGDHAAAFPLLVRSANGGSAEAKMLLGIAYARGLGTEPHPDRAIPLLRGALRRERDPRAMVALGLAYLRDGVSSNEHHAEDWFRKAAEKGDAEGMMRLGDVLLADGAHAQALDWYRQAADSGAVEAGVAIGSMYLRGQGVDTDTAEALRWLQGAEKKGSAQAMDRIGEVHEARGEYAQAARAYQRSVDAGSAEAMTHLGRLYAAGRGVPRDTAEAGRLLRRAADAGSVVARSMVRRAEGG